MRPLKRSIMPLVCEVLGLVRRCPMRLSVQTRSKTRVAVGWRSPVVQKRSVNALPLSVRTLLIVNGALLIRRLRKPLAAVADFYVDQTGGESMAANR